MNYFVIIKGTPFPVWLDSLFAVLILIVIIRKIYLNSSKLVESDDESLKFLMYFILLGVFLLNVFFKLKH